MFNLSYVSHPSIGETLVNTETRLRPEWSEGRAFGTGAGRLSSHQLQNGSREWIVIRLFREKGLFPLGQSGRRVMLTTTSTYGFNSKTVQQKKPIIWNSYQLNLKNEWRVETSGFFKFRPEYGLCWMTFSCSSSGFSGKCRYNISNLIMAFSFRILSNSVFTKHLKTWQCLVLIDRQRH